MLDKTGAMPRTRKPTRARARDERQLAIVTKPNEPIEAFSIESLTYQRKRIRCGKRRCGKCGRNGNGHGPYWYAFWRDGSKVRSRYVGKKLPPDVERARRVRGIA
jgi:hypothetical protein